MASSSSSFGGGGGGGGNSPPRPSSGRRGSQLHPPPAFFGGQTWGGGGGAGRSGSNAGLATSGSLRDAAAMAASVASPLQYNSPTKRFGYTRWPPLISPTPPDHYHDAYAHAHGQGGPAYGGGGQDDGYADVRLEVEHSGHNLTSVMMDPRAPGGVSPELEVGGRVCLGGGGGGFYVLRLRHPRADLCYVSFIKSFSCQSSCRPPCWSSPSRPRPSPRRPPLAAPAAGASPPRSRARPPCRAPAAAGTSRRSGTCSAARGPCCSATARTTTPRPRRAATGRRCLRRARRRTGCVPFLVVNVWDQCADGMGRRLTSTHNKSQPTTCINIKSGGGPGGVLPAGAPRLLQPRLRARGPGHVRGAGRQGHAGLAGGWVGRSVRRERCG